MGKDGYAVADKSQEKMLIDPNGFYDEYGEGTPSQKGGSYDADTNCWNLTSLEENCKVKNNDESLMKALGDNLKSDNTYYGVYIFFFDEEGNETAYYLYVEVGQGEQKQDPR